MTSSPFQSSTIGTVRRAGDHSLLERSDSGWGNTSAFAAISRDGQVVAWGDHAKGGLLEGSTATLLTKQTDVPWIWTVELAASSGAFAARRANGQVVAWGDSAAGGTIPADLAAALHDGVVRVFGLANGFAALKADGRLITWGPGPGTGQNSTDLDLSKPYKVVTSFDSLAILQDGRLVGCWGGTAGASQWAQHAELRSALNSGVLELVSNDAGFAARTATGQVITWGTPAGIGDASGVSITNRPDIVKLGSEKYEFHGFDDKGQIWIWRGFSQYPWEQTQYAAGSGPLPWPYFFPGPITGAQRFFDVSGGGMGWSLKDDSIWLYQVGGGKNLFQSTITTSEPVLSGTNGLAVIRKGNEDVDTFGYELNLNSPNSSGFFSTVSKPADATWQAVRATSGAFAALASDGHVGLWGDAASGGSPANPALTRQLLQQHLPQALYSNQGAFVSLAADGTAISWGKSGAGGDQNGAPQVFTNLDHIVSPWANVRIDEQGPATKYNLIINGQANPEGQTIPLLVQEGDQLSVVIQNDPNGDRVDTTGNVYTWQRNGLASGDNKQASINLDALSTGAWSVTPTYLDLPGFSRTLAPLNVQVQMVDNGQASVSIRPFEFTGPSDQAFSAGNGKVSKLVTTIAGDPEGIKTIDAVQWFRNDTPIPSGGTPARSILAVEEPGSYSFNASYTDNQGYQRTVQSGRVQIAPAGGVPSQSHLATGGLQTLWRLADDGRSVERLDSSSLRMRAVDMAGKAGYLAISASSDNRAWALDNEGFACLYDGASNRFIRQDGSGTGSGNNQQLNLGSGWRQIIAARGSNTAPTLWLLGDAPLDGGSNVAYLPGSLAEGQTLADLKPITLNAGPQLRLLAVGDDQSPWGIDQSGNLWRWDAATSSFGQLAAGVGSRIRQLQMIDQATVWGLDDQGLLLMWNSEKKQFTPVPFDSPFFTQRSAQLIAGRTPTWESFSLSQLGGFVGIPRSGVTTPAGGTGLVCFDTSEIRRLRSASENPSQLQLLSGETLQDNGVRQVGQNLAFNLNNQVNVAYMLNASRPGQWEGAAIVPKAQSGAELRLQPGPNRDPDGKRLPVLKLSWLSGLGNGNNQAYSSLGYVSPFGGLVFTPASKVLPSTANESQQTAALARSANTDLPKTIQLAANYLSEGAKSNPKKDFGLNPDIFSTGLGVTYYKQFEKKLAGDWEMHNTFTMTLGNSTSIKNGWKKNLKGSFQYELEFEKKASDKSRWNTGSSNTLKAVWDDFGSRKVKVQENDLVIGGITIKEKKPLGPETKRDASKLAVGFSFQGTADINDWTDTSKWEFSDNISLSVKTSFPIYSLMEGLFQISATLGLSLDYASKGSGLSSGLASI